MRLNNKYNGLELRSGQVLTRTKDVKGYVKSPPSREVSWNDGGCDFYFLSTFYENERLHPSPLRGTPLKGRDLHKEFEPENSC